MYFQSFGAVAIVKVNASWFHLRERGTFGGIFGILISLGLYLAFDWAPKIAALTSPAWLFLTPAVILFGFFGLSAAIVRDTPVAAGAAKLRRRGRVERQRRRAARVTRPGDRPAAAASRDPDDRVHLAVLRLPARAGHPEVVPDVSPTAFT